ncbi:branched-chain amino acid ABC transporter ATP-binding protein/permease [Bradyrhizobium sp. 83002]|uniref:branched-chain amino acid ABC transporter ATP-binding protein/permease n=1 Tax=Bradyrhizobium aeschynomenes TaxID=2734909 RepID=UPI0015573075|nr:branched-chain amino acid ABC transporter ATP-binding protein/permease [Bradyrhizobium aeschynomenes]NPU10569.1 branched-chain amino acid ABC transporter ATP-binding protein/permease [Bradyrhizobium aeschynomenes]NPV19886.1 branched-chain amino acid ABC transporter ATP-binding protein/permease [Bradyrhizobium aeschynomenes]
MPPLIVPALLVALAAAVILVAPLLLDTYLVNILVRACFVAIAAITVDIMWGYCGTLTFGQSAFFGIGAYALAIMFTEYGFGTWQIFAAIGAAVAVAAAVAAFTGWLSFYPGSTPLYASVISLVVPIVLVQILYSGGTFTGSSSGLVGFESFDLEIETWLRLAGLGLLATAVLALVVMRSDTGRLLSALRDNDSRCTYLGIDTSRLRIVVLVLSAIVSALAGFFYAGFGAVAAPENASFAFGTNLVIMVALGGRGTVIGPVIGALCIEVASAYLANSLPYVWELIVGLALIIVILVFPDGLLGAVMRLVKRGRSAVATTILQPAIAATAVSNPDAVAIEVRALGKHYGSLAVLDGVQFTAYRGELLSLVGPNGAGKTTLIRCLSDGRERSTGNVAIAGHDIARLPPDRVVRFGLGRKFQTASVFETLTVAECLRVARTHADPPALTSRSATLALPPAAMSVVERSGLGERLDEEARNLSHGLKQALELAMVLSLEPDVLLLDEPTAGLTRAERQGFADILTTLARRDRLCILLVEHDLDFVREISSRIIVLHQGRLALDGSVDEVVNSELVREIYTGQHVSHAEVPA